MKRVSYETILEKNWDVILKGQSLYKLKDIEKLKGILDEVPMNFHRLNKLLFKHLDCLEYIDFWKEIKIYKVEY